MKSTVVNIVKEQNKMEDKTYINDLDVIKFLYSKRNALSFVRSIYTVL